MCFLNTNRYFTVKNYGFYFDLHFSRSCEFCFRLYQLINYQVRGRKHRKYWIFSLGKNFMKISYKKLWILLIKKDISPATLRKDLSIATGTMTKLRKNEEVALSVLLRICDYLNCNIGDICDAVKNETYEIGEI